MDSLDTQSDSIDDRAAKIAEANVYSLNNPYLSDLQKVQVEMWFQLPFGLATFAYLSASVLHHTFDVSTYWLIALPIITDALAGILLWYFYSRSLVLIAYATICSKWFLWTASVLVAVYLAWSEQYLLAISVLAVKLGFSLLFGVHMFLFGLLASVKYRMHPKYAFFKKYYQLKFPFEF